MVDPKRLLDTESGRTRELLEVGLSEVAPARVRAEMLIAVSNVVAELDLGQFAASGAGPSLRSGGSDVPGANSVGAPGFSLAPQGGMLAKVVVFAKSSAALKLSAVVATLGVGGLLYEGGQRREPSARAAAGSQTQVGSQTGAGSQTVETAEMPLVTPVAGASGSMHPPAPTLHVDRPAPSVTARPSQPPARRAIERQRAVPRGAVVREAGNDAEQIDELARQVALLARARARLLEGDGEGTLQLLRDYERRFPSATLQPEVDALRRRALVTAMQHERQKR